MENLSPSEESVVVLEQLCLCKGQCTNCAIDRALSSPLALRAAAQGSHTLPHQVIHDLKADVMLQRGTKHYTALLHEREQSLEMTKQNFEKGCTNERLNGHTQQIRRALQECHSALKEEKAMERMMAG